MGKTGLPKDVGSGAWGEVTSNQNLPVDARLVDGATASGPQDPPAYHLPESRLEAQLGTELNNSGDTTSSAGQILDSTTAIHAHGGVPQRSG